MGTGFTTDSPFRLAALGINSVVSLVDDVLIDQLRHVWCTKLGLSCPEVISDDLRAARIGAYLDLMQDEVDRQAAELRAAPLFAGSALDRYFRLLPDGELSREYASLRVTPPGPAREAAERALRERVSPAPIDVNIMTKLDRSLDRRGRPREHAASDAVAAMHGFARSRARGHLVLSAGLNQRLFAAMAQEEGFYPDANGQFPKGIILKVSDFRSADIQSRLLAKKGLWVSEFRIESGLNCGGHAFATDGKLLGPVMAEFRDRRQALREALWSQCTAVWRAAARPVPERMAEQRVSAQGGIGTHAEHQLLLDHYGMDSVGWGSPFLLVPEAVALDEDTLGRLLGAEPGDVYLSNSSPLGVPFWTLRTSPAEELRRKRIAEGRPGSPCLKGLIATDTSLSKVPLCVASAAYQRRKLKQLEEAGAPRSACDAVLEKACICHELGGAVLRSHGADVSVAPSICPGPNVVWFKTVQTLEDMVDHVYGRQDLLEGKDRPHAFIAELSLYLDELQRRNAAGTSTKSYLEHLLQGIEHYRSLLRDGLFGEDGPAFERDLEVQLERLSPRRALEQEPSLDAAQPQL